MVFKKRNGLLGHNLRDGSSLLHGIIPAATLEGLKKGCLVVPYDVLLHKIDEKIDDDLKISELQYLEGGSLLLTVKHREYGEGVLRIRPLAFSVMLEDAMMTWQVDLVEIKAQGLKNKLLARVAEVFPQRVLQYLLEEKSGGDIETKVRDDNTVQVEMTRYVQKLPLAQKRLPLINQSPLAWINLSELTLEPEGFSIKCSLRWNGF